MTWQQVARESGVSAHTIQRTQRQVRFEVDGILALAGRSPPRCRTRLLRRPDVLGSDRCRWIVAPERFLDL